MSQSACLRTGQRSEVMAVRRHVIPVMFFVIVGIAIYSLSFAQGPRYNTPYMSNEWYLTGCNTFSSAEDVYAFLDRYGSFLANEAFKDVDGVIINPAQLIWDAAQTNGVSVELLIFTLEKEQRAITTSKRLPNWRLKKIMGYDPGYNYPERHTTVRAQTDWAAWQFKRYLGKKQLNYPLCNGETVGGWRVGIPKMTTDNDPKEGGCPELEPLYVTPANCAVAALFTYTPYVGQYWGGCYKSGGNSLFEPIWEKRFHFCMPIIYVANYWGSTVSVIDAGTLTVKKNIPVSSGPRRIAFSPGGRHAYVTCSEANRLAVINAETGSVIKNIPVGDFPYDVAASPDGKKVYVTNLDSETMSVIDTGTLSVVKTIFGLRGPRAVHTIGDASAYRVLVGNIPPSFINDPVFIYDPVTDEFIESVIVGKIPVDMDSHRGKAISEDPFVYVSDLIRNPLDYDYDLMVIRVGDPNVPGDYSELYGRIITDRPNFNIEVDRNKVYVSSGTEKVSEYPFLSDVNEWNYYIDSPKGIARAGNKLFVSSSSENSVYVFDEVTRSLITIIPVGDSPAGVALRP